MANALTTIKADALAADLIDETKLADNSIDSEHYNDGSIDTAHIADNQVTLAKMAGGTDGQILTYDASGDPVAVGPGTDGQVLTSTGAGSPPAFEALPAGGISEVDHWRVTSGWTGNADPIASNWERCDTTPGISKLGTGLTESSGLFSFPSTGIWQLYAGFYYDPDDTITYSNITIQTTVDNWSSSENRFQLFGSAANTSGHHGFCFTSGILDVTDIGNIKFRLRATSGDSADTDWVGDSNDSKNYLFAVKLAET